ncbi:hypothetical protein HETIRDRAFT_325691 [Heterobasidion irregulare TC 32-1]|uniref:Phosphatidylglycerol lysyltransferase C-terminal domain-containing protein n=1 Tax=Heterobasidion irregulare (strain TC 32-1) TaxID=747525 RepID=W4JYU0_HETIT|nr:uncharacterized protein HETIRDRAFT_325691 [Heterobasidion irregulare TC 32-1]ETW78036.1 hypothetical protein HETIRDRAFT_325691 [Heterobasidion irregulare TC 32-1]
MTSAIQENETDPSADKADIAALLPAYGSSSATAWLERDRYRVWRPPVSAPVRESTFTPAQGYFRADPYIFAWGNPLVSSPAALVPTVAAFWTWCKQRNLRLVWCCVDGHIERVLGASGSEFGWSTVSCISEDIVDPKEVVHIVDDPGGGSTVKDLKKNLRRSERENVVVREVKHEEWTEEQKRTVEEGIQAWKKSRTGIQIAATSFQPWIDFEHRRFWVAEKDSVIVGILILSPVRPASYQIKNAAGFPNAPRGTAERLIYSAMRDLQDATHLDPRAPEIQDQQSPSEDDRARITVTFGISAADKLTPVGNLSGWKVSWLGKAYGKVVGATGLVRRGNFRDKFHAEHMPMYVCYPTEDGFGLDGINALIKCLRQ